MKLHEPKENEQGCQISFVAHFYVDLQWEQLGAEHEKHKFFSFALFFGIYVLTLGGQFYFSCIVRRLAYAAKLCKEPAEKPFFWKENDKVALLIRKH